MSAAVELGYKPRSLIVRLVTGFDWHQTGRRPDGQDWPPGTVIALHHEDGQVWTATIDGPRFSWHVDKAAVATIRDGSSVYLSCTAGATELPWLMGEVIRHG